MAASRQADKKPRSGSSRKLAIHGGKPVRDSFLVFGAPRIEEDEIQEVVDTLRSGWLSTGPRVKRFEQEFKAYVGASYAVATSSCTAAMHLGLLASGIGAGDEVIVPTMTFAATANVVEHVGAKPVFVDSEPDGFNIDPEQVESYIKPRTKAIMPVHFAGKPCRMDEINGIAARHGLVVIEDAAHAVGAQYRGRPIGGLGNLTAFSFYVTKNLATAEGGMLTTEDPAIADRAQVLGLHGMDLGAWQRYEKRGRSGYQVVAPGFKYNLTDIAAALGLHQLRKLDRSIEVRTRYAEAYDRAFADTAEIILPEPSREDRHAWHLYPVLVQPELLSADRDDVVTALAAENIGTGVHFRAVHTHPYYRDKYEIPKGTFPRAEFISERVFSLPLSPALSDGDVESVIEAVRKIIRHYRR